MLQLALVFGLAAAALCPVAEARADTAGGAARGPIATLQGDVVALATTGVGAAGKVGVAAWRLDGAGPKLLVNADEAFPMASTFKVAVAGAVLQRVEEGRLGLDRMISIDLDRMVDSEILADRFIHPGLSISVYNLLELMLTQSDNTATDYMVEAAGGPAAVTAWAKAQGVVGLRVDGGTDEIIRRFFRLGPGPFPKALAAAAASTPDLSARAERPDPSFDLDPRDTASPRAMAELLTRIFQGRALSPDKTAILIGMMTRCRTGVGRLRALMPPDTKVADKTGTIGGTVNDVGVLTLPGGGEVVVAAFIKASDAPMAAREKAIAQIGRAVRDFYLYEGGAGGPGRGGP
jgi:beta-lactamase class A